jgi:hypothetical protein
MRNATLLLALAAGLYGLPRELSAIRKQCAVLNAVVCSRVRELQEALSAATSALEISGRNALVAAIQKRWDRPRRP